MANMITMTQRYTWRRHLLKFIVNSRTQLRRQSPPDFKEIKFLVGINQIDRSVELSGSLD